jgi:MFS family permease
MKTVTMQTEEMTYSTVRVPVEKLHKNLPAVFIFCFASTLVSGIASMLMSVYLPVVVKELLGDVSEEKLNNVSAVINSVFIFGWMLGGFSWGIICDRIGRSRSVLLSTACYALFTVLTGLSSSWFLVSVCRFFTGFGIGGLLVTATVLIEELWTDKKKAIVQGMVALAMPVGFFAAGAINNLSQDWRAAFWIGLIPAVLAIIAALILPESEMWKATKLTLNQKEKSNRLFAPGHRKNLVSGSVIFGAMLIGLWAIFSWAPTWVQSISHATNVEEQRGLTMMVLAGSGIVGSFFSGWIVNGIGLRKTMLMCFGACFIMSFVVFKLNSDIAPSTFAEMGVLVFFFGISQGALAVYIPELFPTGVRASATGFCFNVGRLFTATVVFFIGALVSMLGGYGNSIFIFSFIFIAGFIATLLTPSPKQD